MSSMALLAAQRPTEVPKGPFVAFQQGKDALPDGRRVSNWYLLDDSGNSVLAVVGVESERRDAHYHYSAQVPFDRATPLNCNNQGDVKKWLAGHVQGGTPPQPGSNFQLPDKRESGAPSAVGEAELRRQLGTGRNRDQKPLPLRPPSARAAAAAVQSQGGYAVQAAGNYGLSNGPSAPRDTAFIENAAQRRAFVNEALRSVEARLNLLAARAGLSYTLTTHSHERAVRVTASHGVTLVAQRPLPDPRVKREDSDDYSSSESERPVRTRKRSAPAPRSAPAGKRAASAQRARAASPDDDDDAQSDGSGGNQSNLGLAALLHAATGHGAREPPAEAEQQLPAQHVPLPGPLQPPQPSPSPVQRQPSSPAPPDVPRMSRAQQQAQAQAAARSDPDLRAMLPHIAGNREQQMPGLWRREHWAEQPYVEIDSYQVALEGGEEVDKRALYDKLQARFRNAQGQEIQLREGNPATEQFMLANKVAVLDELPPSLNESEYREGSMWGVDRFTRSNIFEALGRCKALAVEGDAAASEAARDAFIEGRLLPQANALEDDGWDIMAVLRELKDAAETEGDASTVAACKTLARVVETTERHFKAAGRRSGLPLPPGPIEDRDYFRLWPKGQGVVCTKKGGLPEHAFVAPYLGEIYCTWAWAERQQLVPSRANALGKRSRMRMGLPEYYNCLLERPAATAPGYDLIHVDASQKGNFTARLAHSCVPSCKAVTLIAGGRLVIGIYTTRPIAEGEELTLDYKAETESEKEPRHAICLCGASHCRGSFLYHTNTANTPQQQIMAQAHTFLDRNALLLRAGGEEAGDVDYQALSNAGIRHSVLCSRPDGRAKLPKWVVRWASLALAWIHSEHAALPKLLTSQEGQGGGYGFSVDEAQAEADDLRAARLQSLVVALDKAKLFLRHQPREMRALGPLRLMTDDEVLEYLWTGSDSQIKRIAGAVRAVLQPSGAVPHPAMLTGPTASRGQRKAAPPADRHLEATQPGRRAPGTVPVRPPGMKRPRGRPRRVVPAPEESGGDDDDDDDAERSGSRDAAGAPASDTPPEPALNGDASPEQEERAAAALEALEGILSREPATAAEARACLGDIAELLRAQGPGHAAMYDLVVLLLETKCFISPTPYETFQSVMWSSEEMAQKAQRLAARDAVAGGAQWQGGAADAGKQASLGGAAASGQSPASASTARPGTAGKDAYRYRAGFLWGTLSGWARPAGGDALVALGTDRRGCLTLPDPDCCYLPAFSSGKYCSEGEREALLSQITRQPSAPWSTASNWSFRNTVKVYGSPMFDLVVARHGLAVHLTGTPDAAAQRLATVLQRLRTAFPAQPGDEMAQ